MTRMYSCFIQSVLKHVSTELPFGNLALCLAAPVHLPFPPIKRQWCQIPGYWYRSRVFEVYIYIIVCDICLCVKACRSMVHLSLTEGVPRILFRIKILGVLVPTGPIVT